MQTKFKTNTMKKYRIKNEMYRKPAQEIAGFKEGVSLPLEYYVSIEGSAMRKRLEEYGVFELWFEEVPKYKAGDYIYIIDTGNIYEIGDCEVEGDELRWNIAGWGIRGWGYMYCTHLDNIRQPTAEEIKEYNQHLLPYIGKYRGKLQYHYIIYGCKSIHVQDFIRLYEACRDLEVNSITIKGIEVQMETMQEIYEKIQ